MNGFEINIVDAILIFVAAVIPLYLTFRLEGHLRMLAAVLFAFVIIHALYHSFAVVGYDIVADNIVEPLSVVVLIIFGLAYLKTSKRSIIR
ncbi:MAG: hypothetical protein HZA82_05860 [Thaumarchaeota archaeon]|nr:hypothetical protein [Nitrososphaerota archaeon]